MLDRNSNNIPAEEERPVPGIGGWRVRPIDAQRQVMGWNGKTERISVFNNGINENHDLGGTGSPERAKARSTRRRRSAKELSSSSESSWEGDWSGSEWLVVRRGEARR